MYSARLPTIRSRFLALTSILYTLYIHGCCSRGALGRSATIHAHNHRTCLPSSVDYILFRGLLYADRPTINMHFFKRGFCACAKPPFTIYLLGAKRSYALGACFLIDYIPLPWGIQYFQPVEDPTASGTCWWCPASTPAPSCQVE